MRLQYNIYVGHLPGHQPPKTLTSFALQRGKYPPKGLIPALEDTKYGEPSNYLLGVGVPLPHASLRDCLHIGYTALFALCDKPAMDAKFTW